MKLYDADLAYSDQTDLALARDKLDHKCLPKLNKIWRTTSQVNSIKPKYQKNFESLVEINPLLNLPLAETVAALTQIIDFETNILENNYRSEFLSANRKGGKLKILVIEDRDDSRNYICSMLRTENFQVIEAKETCTAIRLAHAEIPDLIICELMMPIVNGYGVADLLCHSTITGNMLLLFITAHYKQTKVNSEIFLVSDREEIEPLTKEKLLRAVNRHANMMTV